MSLLNDALRKKTSDDNKKETGYLDRRHFAQRDVNGGKISRIFGLPLLLGGLVFGIWYFWGSLSAQTNSPVAASSISKDIENNESSLHSALKKDEIEEVESESDMLKPQGEITPVEESVEIDTIKKTEPPAKSRIKKVSTPPPKKAKKKSRFVKKKVPQKPPKVKEKPFPSNQDALFLQKALRYHRQGKFNQAIQMYQQVLKVKPDHRDALFNLASAYIQLTAYSEAYPLLKKLRSYDYGNPDVLVNLAIVEIGMGKAAEAIHLLDLATKQSKEPNFKINFHRAAALSRLGRLEEALLSYKTAEELNPKHSALNFNLAVLCDKLHKYNEAVNYYQTYLRHSDNLPRYEEKKIESRISSLRAYLAGSRS